MHYPAPGERPDLGAQALSRLLLAGYRLPALAQPGSLPALKAHVTTGRHVFVRLGGVPASMGGVGSAETAPAVVQVQGLIQEESEAAALLLSEARAVAPSCYRLGLEQFTAAWTAGANGMVVAARRWEDLPGEGISFFGGTRDTDGSFHWDVAECDTDSHGRILRY
jgi:hypothetical protein